MTQPELEQLRFRIVAGERPIQELCALRNSALDQGIDADTIEALSDLWNLAYHHEGLFPRLEAAKALVEAALAGDSSYPILTNDGLIYDSLSQTERHELVEFITSRIAETEAAVAKPVLIDFAEELLGAGPQV